VLADAAFDVDGQPRDVDPDVGADEYTAIASLPGAGVAAELAFEPVGEELLTTSLGALAVNDEPLTAEPATSTSLIDDSATAAAAEEESALIELLAKDMTRFAWAREWDAGANAESFRNRLTATIDALWEEFR
jgi:hypothetical protein